MICGMFTVFFGSFVKTPKVSQESPCDGAKHTSVACVIFGKPSRLAQSIIEYGLDQYFTSSMYLHALLCIYRLFKNIFAEISEKMTCQLGHLPLKNRGDSSGLNLWTKSTLPPRGLPLSPRNIRQVATDEKETRLQSVDMLYGKTLGQKTWDSWPSHDWSSECKSSWYLFEYYELSWFIYLCTIVCNNIKWPVIPLPSHF